MIITADWHLRPDLPRCRKDNDWIETQLNVVAIIIQSAKEKKCPVFIIGDIFHVPTIPTSMMNKLVQMILESGIDVYILPGNHDAQYHNIDNLKKSSYGLLQVLANSNHNIYSLPDSAIDNLTAFNFGQETESDSEIICTHQLVWPDEKTKPNMAEGITAAELLQQYPKAKYIFTGDYHHNFCYETKGRYVINPGCITVQVADMIDYTPGFYFVDTAAEKVEFIELPHDKTMIDDKYISNNKERDSRISAFVESVKSGKKVSLDFKENLNNKAKTLKDNSVLEILEELATELV